MATGDPSVFSQSAYRAMTDAQNTSRLVGAYFRHEGWNHASDFGTKVEDAKAFRFYPGD